MSLSSVITDMEAEGVNHLSTATILTSRSVTSSVRASVFENLFGDADTSMMQDEDEESVTLDQATAFGKQFGREDEEKVGVAIANPSASTSVNAADAAMTVLSTHGSVIYVCHPVDLQRQEGLFQDLAPAVERLLMHQNQNENSAAELIVIFQGMTDPSELEEAKAKFEAAAAIMLSNHIITPTSSKNIRDIFETVEYLSESAASTSLFKTLMEGKGQLLDPAEAAASVASAVSSAGGPFDATALLGRGMSPLSPVDLAASRKLGPLSRQALQSTLTKIQELTSLQDADSDSNQDETQLVSGFGALVEASIAQTMTQFDESSAPFQKSSITKRKRADLLQQIYVEVGDIYDNQLSQLKTACFESFRKGLSKLRVSPTLPQDMQSVLQTTVQQFDQQSKLLLPTDSKSKSYTSLWSSPTHAKAQFARSLKEYCTDRLNAAKASGNYRPLPRKGVTLGFHWLLPKPFGNDYRLNPSDVYSGSQLHYSPRTNKVAEIGQDEVSKNTGDWRKTVIPIPAASEMMYQAAKQNE